MSIRGFTLIELAIVISIIAIIAAIAIPAIVNAQISARELHTENGVRRFVNGENDFYLEYRAYWVRDVVGLRVCYPLVGAGKPGHYIRERIGMADRNPGAENVVYYFPSGIVKIDEYPWAPLSYFGHWYLVLNGFIEDGEEKSYGDENNGGIGAGQPTGNPGNTSKFGFIAYPIVYAKDGRYAFIISESNQIYKKLLDGNFTFVPASPPKLLLGGKDYLWFPEQPSQEGWKAQ